MHRQCLLPQCYNNTQYYSRVSVHGFKELLELFFSSKDQVGTHDVKISFPIKFVLKWMGRICNQPFSWKGQRLYRWSRNSKKSRTFDWFLNSSKFMFLLVFDTGMQHKIRRVKFLFNSVALDITWIQSWNDCFNCFQRLVNVMCIYFTKSIFQCFKMPLHVFQNFSVSFATNIHNRYMVQVCKVSMKQGH